MKRIKKNATCPCNSGKDFLDCHGVVPPPAQIPQEPVLAAPTKTVKLDLAGGQNVREGFEGVDVWPGSKHIVDLLKFPWPFEDNSVDELHCSHFIEHIPAREVEQRDLKLDHGGEEALAHAQQVSAPRFVGQDMLLAFFDECYRILKPEGTVTLICPCGRSNRAFQDPTHRRFIVSELFYYLNAEWRKMNKLDHYKVECDFGFNVTPGVPTELTALSAEAQARRFNHEWNTIADWHVFMKSLKKAS